MLTIKTGEMGWVRSFIILSVLALNGYAEKDGDGKLVRRTETAVVAQADSQAMVSLDDILDKRASTMGMVPAAAANDQDFITFMTAIRSRDRITGKPRPIAQTFEAESQTSGLNSYELYQKMKGMLEALRATSQSLYGVVYQMSQGLGHSSTQVATSATLSIERGIRLGFGIGWERRGRWFVPIITIRGGHVYVPHSGWTVLGVMADLGVETRKSGQNPSLVNVTDADLQGFAVGAGFSKMSCSNSTEEVSFHGAMVGLGSQCHADLKGVTVKIPFFLPLPGSNPVRKALRIEAKIIQALQRFDMTRASALISQYKVQVAKCIKMAQKQGLGNASYTLENGHPLLSPGNLFSGSALVAYSPGLAPDLVALYKTEVSKGGWRRAKACESAVIDIDTSPVIEAPVTKQLPP